MTKLSPAKNSVPTSSSESSMGIQGIHAIPKFVKPTRAREISNISFDNGASGHLNMNGNDEQATVATSITFGRQENLPPLPVPTLEETMNKFLRHLEALEADGDPEDRRATEQIVREFLFDKRDHDSGTTTDSCVTGPVLQELLLDYDTNGRKSGAIGSYVEEFWSDAYLAPDSSVVLNLNPYFLLEESPDPKLAGHQIRRAASLCFASVKMASQLRNETLKPDTVRGKILCMAQFKALFGAARVPKKCRDTVATYEKSNHVAVMCRKQLFYFQALWPDNGDVAVSEEDIVNILEAIQCHASKLESNTSDARNEAGYLHSVSALGVLTSLARNQWAKARDEMIEGSTKNAESLHVVDSALFVLVLDDYIPSNKHEAAANMLHGSYELSEWKAEGDACVNEYQSGSCTNRWYDKLQIIVTADGGAGINFEHSAIDGHTALRFVSDIYADTVISFAQSITKMVHAHKGLIPSVITANVRRAAEALDCQGRKLLDVAPKKITFELSDSIKRKIYFAETALGDEILACDTHILEFRDYGKQFITFNKMSPDSYVQMSMMLAYYRLYGKIVCAYEPVLTKGFYHGRTEAMRPATMEAKNLCEVFCNPSSSRQDKVSALRNATVAHSKLVKDCAQGKGVDRHLFALKCIAEKNGLPIPEFFRSEAWRKLNHTVLSTSNCGNPSLLMFGFGPVVPDGYGIGYIIKDTHLHYAIASKHRQTTRYALTLEGVLREMASLLEPLSNTKVHDHGSRLPRHSLASTLATNDSYGDLWGENSFQSSIESKIDTKRPEVIHESTAEKRWSGDSNIVQPPMDDEFLVEPIKMPLKDEIPGITAINKEMRSIESKRRQRRGSNDMMPVRPDRRSSVTNRGLNTNALNVSKGDLSELMNLDAKTEKLDDYLEETKNADSDINSQLSSPLVASLNDEVDGNIVITPVPEPLPGDRVRSGRLVRRGSNDLMPIMPNRRSSVKTRMVGNVDMVDPVNLDDEPAKTEQ